MPSKLATVDYAIIAAYLLGMVALGAFLASRIRHFKDYFLAGGALTTPLLICTLVSSYYGLDVTFGTSESGYYYGLAAWFWYSFPYYIFIAIGALVISRRLRRFSFMTLPDFLEHHYGKGTRIVGATACFFYSAPIIAMAGMMTMLQWLGLSVEVGLLIAVTVCALYTILGGLWADAVSDTIQFVLMCVTLAVTIPLAIQWLGGWDFVKHLPVDAETGTQTHLTTHGGLSFWILVSWAATGLTVLVEPAFYQRVFAAKDQKSITRALLLGILLWAAYDWAVVLIGMIAAAAAESGTGGLPADMEGREALLSVCTTLLPTGLRGLFLGGILASAMSTVDSYSLLASGNLVYDIYRPLRRRPLSDKQMLLLTRIGVFVVMIAAAGLSLLFERLRDAWQFMASVLTSVVLVPVLGAMFGQPRRAAGLCATVTGLFALVSFYVLLFSLGEYDPNEETYVLRFSQFEIWQDSAALCAIPVSLAGFVIGNLTGKK